LHFPERNFPKLQYTKISSTSSGFWDKPIQIQFFLVAKKCQFPKFEWFYYWISYLSVNKENDFIFIKKRGKGSEIIPNLEISHIWIVYTIFIFPLIINNLFNNKTIQILEIGTFWPQEKIVFGWAYLRNQKR
jgi:hypothetical protein